MKLLLQTAFCWWCLLATVAPGADGAQVDLSSEMKKRLSIWLQGRVKRELGRFSGGRAIDSVLFVRPEDIRDTLNPHSRTDINIRVKRSKNSSSLPRKSGCKLSTCQVHDLPHQISQMSVKHKIAAPESKIRPSGYGRRRRSLPARRAPPRHLAQSSHL